MAKSTGRKLPERVFIKAVHLQRAEGKTREQALGMAAGMERAHRLTNKGEYIKKKGK